ncbi:MAG: polysaccharide biosynthesis/export family protein [Deltaproteobacteria bacterium]|nr:polysaccharide biosynthesis/export family protein [Deltaproteobacteria bacterium]
MSASNRPVGPDSIDLGWTRRLRSFTLLLLAFATAGAMGCATPPPTPPPDAPIPTTYRVGPPDTLFVSILPDPVIERTVTIRPDGRISIDLIGDVVAGGRTTEEISEEIQERISRYKRDAVATVSVELARSQAVTVFGEVRAPGVFALEHDTRISEGIGMRGGVTQLSWKTRCRLIRTQGDSTVVMPINMKAIMQGELSTNVLLRGGDIIVVPPNPLASFGYLMQNILFPFAPIISPTLSALSFAGI